MQLLKLRVIPIGIIFGAFHVTPKAPKIQSGSYWNLFGAFANLDDAVLDDFRFFQKHLGL